MIVEIHFPFRDGYYPKDFEMPYLPNVGDDFTFNDKSDDEAHEYYKVESRDFVMSHEGFACIRIYLCIICPDCRGSTGWYGRDGEEDDFNTLICYDCNQTC